MGQDNKKMGYGGYSDSTNAIAVNPSSKKQRRLSLPTMGMRSASPKGRRARANTGNFEAINSSSLETEHLKRTYTSDESPPHPSLFSSLRSSPRKHIDTETSRSESVTAKNTATSKSSKSVSFNFDGEGGDDGGGFRVAVTPPATKGKREDQINLTDALASPMDSPPLKSSVKHPGDERKANNLASFSLNTAPPGKNNLDSSKPADVKIPKGVILNTAGLSVDTIQKGLGSPLVSPVAQPSSLPSLTGIQEGEEDEEGENGENKQNGETKEEVKSSSSQSSKPKPKKQPLFKDCASIWDVFIKLRALGQGFCCDVFLVRYRNPHHRGKFALKVLQQDELGLMLFKREIRMLSIINHPGIVKFYDAYKDDKHYAMLVEYLSGGELFDRVMAKGKFDEESGAEVMKLILEPVAYLHKSEIAHRDLKLENIMYDSRLKPRVIDFGFATKIKNERSYDIVGAALFLSPELVLCSRDRTKRLTGDMLKACDMWATGVITYAILTGCHLFFGETDRDIMDGILRGRINFATGVNLSINARDFIRKLLVRDGTKRMSAEACLRHPWIVEKTAMKGVKKRERRSQSFMV